MRSFFAVALICAFALAGSTPGAVADAPAVSAAYDCMGPDGVLTVAGSDGTHVCAVDAMGIPVASGVVSGGQLSMYAPNSGPDASGVLLRVFAGQDVLAIENGYSDWWLD